MARALRFLVAATAVLAIGALIVTLPPATRTIDADRPSTTVLGAYHVHSVRSDGSGTIDEIAAAARRAGLQFVLVTDHGDGTRRPDPPAYRQQVLVIDGVEVSTRDGHVVALGLTEAAPYPLGGEARDVIEDVRRLGGWTVAAHPDSEKPDLRYRGPATDGVEWINADSEWRDESVSTILRAAIHSLIRPEAAITSLFDHPQASFRRWQNWSRGRLVPGLAAVDAHARISVREHEEPRQSRTLLARPSYEATFRTLAQGVWLSAPLTGDAATDAAQVLEALRTGRTYSAVTGLAAPALLDLAVDADGHLDASIAGGPTVALTLIGDGETVAEGQGHLTAQLEPGRSGYRLLAAWPGADVPWIVTAPFAPREGATPAPATGSPAVSPPAGHRLAAGGPWAIEHAEGSQGSWTTDGEAVRFDFTLGTRAADHPFAALVHPLDSATSVESLAFMIAADRPQRVSVQVRMPTSHPDGERWIRSVYADQTPRLVHLRLEDFEPVVPTSRRPIAARLRTLLFVAAGPHAPPGSTGTLTVSDVRLIGPAPALTSGRSGSTTARQR